MLIEKISIDQITLDRKVQRELNQAWAEKIAREMDLSQIGIITVSKRQDGSTIILDGQHRIEALRIAGKTGYEIDCRVLNGLTIEEEARTFRILNNTKKPNLIDHFLIRVVEGDSTAIDITKILGRFGWQPSRSKSDGSFSAISTIEAIYRGSREAAWSTIQTITEAWENNITAANGQIISGIGSAYQRYGDEIIVSRMVQQLSRIPPTEFIARARALAAARARRVGCAISELAIAEYNRQRGPKLPDWNAPRSTNRLVQTEHIRALTKVANETVVSDVVVPTAMFVDAADLMRATPNVSQDGWR